MASLCECVNLGRHPRRPRACEMLCDLLDFVCFVPF
ncbi:hypothetical protein F383_33834 [Gossypium arboreum]|uniref:Uncharacterized protein n=1 Tax=Gossypium arboreum TaxID=29729 RepID=A0A0B0N0G5_GOSAR|nr:hypothetical protein F383_33834 [Gossypium arboreum]